MRRTAQLTEALEALVQHHGISSVLHELADIQASSEAIGSAGSTAPARQAPKRKPSAIPYVGKMSLPPQKAEVMAQAARRFEEKRFLPTIADIREFARVHGFEIGKTASRGSAIPRVFGYLATIDTSKLTDILQSGEFAGPTHFGPIADAIRRAPAGATAVTQPRSRPPTTHAGQRMRTRDATIVRQRQ